MRISLTSSARSLRQRSTDAERKLWSRLRDHRLMGFKFKRQVPRGRYVVDFLCVEAGLVIEIDGSQHAERARDRARTADLEKEGLTVLRFWNTDVLKNMDGVLTAIAGKLFGGSSPSPGASRRPLPQGRGEKALKGTTE